MTFDEAKKVRVDLLRLAADHETVPEDHVDLNDWKCGSFGCFIGHAAEVPEIAAHGLSLIEGRPGHLFPAFRGVGITIPRDPLAYRAPAAAFALSLDEARHLFSPSCYDSVMGARAKSAVLSRVRSFCDEVDRVLGRSVADKAMENPIREHDLVEVT